MRVCSAGPLCHYLLDEGTSAISILKGGRVSAQRSSRFLEMAGDRKGAPRDLPVPLWAVRRTPTSSAIPELRGLLYAHRLPSPFRDRSSNTPRFAVPIAAVPPERSALTYEWEGQRLVLPVINESLEQAADIMPQWFGRARNIRPGWRPPPHTCPANDAAQYAFLNAKYDPRMVPASFDFCLANLNRATSSAGTSIPSESLNPTARFAGSSIVYITLTDRPL